MSMRAHWLPRPLAGWSPGESVASFERLCLVFERKAAEIYSQFSTSAIVKALDDTLARWQMADSPWLSSCLEQLHERTGWPKAMLDAGMRDMLSSWREPHMTDLLQLEFDSPDGLDGPPSRAGMSRPPKMLGVLLSGNVPVLGIPELIRALMLKTPVVFRLPSAETITLPLFARALSEVEPLLADCILMLHWPKEKTQLYRALFRMSEDIVFYGGSRSREALLSLCPPTAEWHQYGPRLSLAWIDSFHRDQEDEPELARAASDAARQVALYDQLGCLSPHAVYVKEDVPGRALRFAELLADAMSYYETQWPRRKLSLGESQKIQAARQKYLMRALNGSQIAHESVQIRQSERSTAWTVVYSPEPDFELSPGNRFIFVKPLRDWRCLTQILYRWRGYLSTLGVDGRIDTTEVQGFFNMGFSRICALNRMQTPPSTWRHDGRSTLRRFLHSATWES